MQSTSGGSAAALVCRCNSKASDSSALSVRYSASGRAAIESLLVDVLSEGLRCDLFLRQAAQRLTERQRRGLTLPRPPELFDLIQRSTDEIGSVVVYPDPPIPTVEREIIDNALRRVAPNTEIKTLGELS